MSLLDVRCERTIRRPRREVAAYAADPDNTTACYSNIKAVEWETPRPLAVRSRLAFIATFLGRRLAYTYEIGARTPTADFEAQALARRRPAHGQRGAKGRVRLRMELGLADNVALVGGGGTGLGRAAAEALASEGAAVAIFGRGMGALEAAASEIAQRTGTRVLPLAADVTSAADCERVVAATRAELGGLDVLVTNMGGPPYGAAADRSDEEWQRAWELVTLSVIRLCRAAAAPMAERGGGSIVNITTPGVHQLIPTTALSTVARMATTGFAKYLATELAPHGIRVNNVLPGWISTQRVSELAAAEAAAREVPVETVYAEQRAAIPIGRFGDPAEVADTIAFLASSRSSYITGTNVRVDGGWSTATSL